MATVIVDFDLYYCKDHFVLGLRQAEDDVCQSLTVVLFVGPDVVLVWCVLDFSLHHPYDYSASGSSLQNVSVPFSV